MSFQQLYFEYETKKILEELTKAINKLAEALTEEKL